MTKPSYKPACPNHDETLTDTGFPLPAKGTGICPVSGATFEFEADVDSTQMVLDKAGNLTKKPVWNLTGNE